MLAAELAGETSVAGCWRASASLLPAGWVSVLGLAAWLAGTEVPGAVDAPPVLPPLPPVPPVPPQLPALPPLPSWPLPPWPPPPELSSPVPPVEATC